jgi:hypothetical protein
MDANPYDQRFSKPQWEALCFATPGDENASKLEQNVRTCLPAMQTEWHASVENLISRLLGNLDKKMIALVSVATENDLIDLYFIQHHLRRAILVLLLPDTERHTIAMGHRLNPYFMCTADTEVSELMDVLKTIVVHGTPPKSIEQFRNPFEAPIPHRALDFNDHWIQAA